MRILYLTCLISKKEKYDGERIKNTLVFDSLKKISDVDVIDFTKNKYINVFKTFWVTFFKKKKYDYFIISKDPHGANVIQKILNITRIPSSKIIYFEIGPFLYDRILNGSIKKETFINDRLIVVETKSMKRELESLGFKNVDVFPNFKSIYNIKFNDKKYPKNVLNLIYFSRIEDQKGIYDLIECLKEINEHAIKYTLDVFGRPQNKNEEERIVDICNKYSYLNYKGKLDINGSNSYEQLSRYDLHVFPTKYAEGFPGTIIDFFIAGVPTLASSFARAKDILSSNDSIIFKQGDRKDLLNKLKYIYENQSLLSVLGKNSYCRKDEYSIKAFDLYLSKIFGIVEEDT
ncbi:MAG: glycosyltransferase [Clostridia bacterium]|nr:glycosyltransferase [Clostridia bacterium]